MYQEIAERIVQTSEAQRKPMKVDHCTTMMIMFGLNDVHSLQLREYAELLKDMEHIEEEEKNAPHLHIVRMV